VGSAGRVGWQLGGRLLTVGEKATIWAVMDATGADVLAQRALGTLVAHVQRERPAQGPLSDPVRRRGVSGLHRIPSSSTTTVDMDAYADMHIHTALPRAVVVVEKSVNWVYVALLPSTPPLASPPSPPPPNPSGTQSKHQGQNSMV
jgi:hypothetical protein